MAAAALFTDPAGRLLLVEPTYKDHWELPGGGVEADESPRDGVIREIQEELGLDIEPGRLLAVDWVPPQPNRTEGVMLVYDGGTLDAAQQEARKVHRSGWSTTAAARPCTPNWSAKPATGSPRTARPPFRCCPEQGFQAPETGGPTTAPFATLSASRRHGCRSRRTGS